MERQRSDYCKDQGAGCAVPYLATGSRRSEKPFCPAFHAGVAGQLHDGRHIALCDD